jgi:hypothetical protein
VTSSLAASAKLGDYALMDAAGDAAHGDGARLDGRQLRYYLIRVTRAARTLTARLCGTDWGDLEVGTLVLDGEYYWLVYSPRPTVGCPARWYVTGRPRRYVTLPADVLLSVGFDVSPAVLHSKSNQRQAAAVERGAIVLSEEVHRHALVVLQQRS